LLRENMEGLRIPIDTHFLQEILLSVVNAALSYWAFKAGIHI
jgi:hypothetical protein